MRSHALMCKMMLTESMSVSISQFALKHMNKAMDNTRRDERQSRLMKGLSDIRLDLGVLIGLRLSFNCRQCLSQ